MRSSPPPPSHVENSTVIDEALFSQANCDGDDAPPPFNTSKVPKDSVEEDDVYEGSSSSSSSDDDEEDSGDDDDEEPVDNNPKEKPANAYVSPSGQVRSKDTSTILQLGASSYASKASGANPRASMAPPALPHGNSTLAEEGASLPAGDAPFPHQFPQQQPAPEDTTADPTPSEAAAKSTDEDTERSSRSYKQLLKPPQYSIFCSYTVVAAMWTSLCFKGPFLDKDRKNHDVAERFKSPWLQATKIAGLDTPAPFTSNVWRCVSGHRVFECETLLIVSTARQ